MKEFSCCIECGAAVTVSHPSVTVRVEECGECERQSHWRECTLCGEVNGPRRVICLECGVPFQRQEAMAKAMGKDKSPARRRSLQPVG